MSVCINVKMKNEKLYEFSACVEAPEAARL